MKLNSKFALIVSLNVVLVLTLTAFSLHSSKKIQDFKDYQYMQAKTYSDLSNIVLYLDEMDNWGFKTTTAFREWNILVEKVQEDFDFLFEARSIKYFDDDFKSALNETKTLWEMLLVRFDPINDGFEEMESIKLPISIYTYTEGNGIEYAYEKLPDDPKVIRLKEIMDGSHETIKGIRRSYQTLSLINRKCSIMMEDLLDKEHKTFTISILVAALFTCLVLSLLVILATTNITKRIIKIRDITSILAGKDFTVSIEPAGSTEMQSLMTNINNMINQLKAFFDVVKQSAAKAIDSGYLINDSADDTAAATAEINENINMITEKFSLIESAVNNAVSAIELMNRQVDTLVQNNSQQTIAIADSNEAVNEAVKTLAYINQMAGERAKSAEEMHQFVADGDGKISQTSDLLAQITDDLDEVNEVVDIINNVAEQTNLLSMNAAIESAHAGEAGKGFSVVAEEIRSLAESTSENATKIASVIKSIVDAVHKANTSSTEASSAFAKVSSHADSVVLSLRDISKGIDKIDAQMQQIKYKSEETAVTADKINTYCGELAEKQNSVTSEVKVVEDQLNQTMEAIHMIKAGTEDIVTRMQNVSDASKENYKNMAELDEMLSEFKTTVVEEEEGLEEEIEQEIENS